MVNVLEELNIVSKIYVQTNIPESYMLKLKT